MSSKDKELIVEVTNTPSMPTGINKRIMARTLYEAAKKYFENPDNMKRYQEWYLKTYGHPAPD